MNIHRIIDEKLTTDACDRGCCDYSTYKVYCQTCGEVFQEGTRYRKTYLEESFAFKHTVDYRLKAIEKQLKRLLGESL